MVQENFWTKHGLLTCGIAGVMILEGLALSMGVNGMALSASIAAIFGIVGFGYGKTK